MLASVRSATLLGIDGQVVTVEVHVSSGLPAFTVVGLPDAAGRESRERIRAAFGSSGFEFPLRRITVNLAPGGVRKAGAGLELAIAVALLVASEELAPATLDGLAVLGELGLDGGVRRVPGTLALVDALHRAGATRVVVPEADAPEAALVDGTAVLVARRLGELRDCLAGELPWPDPPPPAAPADVGVRDEVLDLADVRGLPRARRALAAAAAGGHHLLLVGPPGAGKTMLARRLESILPPLPRADALEITRIHSAAGRAVGGLATRRPFRAPHHTASAVALVGGGSPRPRPGEITLAHRGALFLDELAEFSPRALDALRQPLEERVVRISRQALAVDLPADFLLVACSNPCPCGRAEADCRCSEAARARFRVRVSAPLLDRFDLRLYVRPPEPGAPRGPASDHVRDQVVAAWERQAHRYADHGWSRNGDVPASALDAVLPLSGACRALWLELCEQHTLTGRGAARVRRVARTLADLDRRDDVAEEHLEEAAGLREDVLA